MIHALPKHATDLLAALLIGCCGSALAHEGHHHDDDTADQAPAAAAAPHAGVDTPQLEVVAQREGAELVFYIDDYASNAPLDGLQVGVRSGALTLQAAGGAGRYAVPAGVLGAPPAQPLELEVHGAGVDAQLAVPLPEAAPEPAPAPHPQWPERLASGALIVLLLLAAWLLRRRRSAEVAEAGAA
jgi:MYXO-CTERM domain-containing protein